ncbi:MAG: PH domain-containing protein [Polyangiaceae bacterium]
MTSPANATDSPTTHEEVLFDGRPALVASIVDLLLAIVTVGIWLLPRWWRSLGVHYRITTRRIVVETGVLSKRMEQIDLYRVNDYTVDRPFSQRLLGSGNLLLKTFDKTTPELRIVEIKTDVVALYEQLRQATEKDRAARGVRMVDYEN